MELKREIRCWCFDAIGNNNFILSADGFAGHDDVVIKPLVHSDQRCYRDNDVQRGRIVLILDIKELLDELQHKI